jgi:lipopolysaccharide export system protein LptA
MNMKFTKILFSIVFTLITFVVFGQQKPKQAQTDRVELQGADVLEGGVFNGQRITKLLGNVVFKQKDTFLYADSVYQYRDKDVLEAFGNVRMNQADSVTMSADRATYDGLNRTAKMSGNVVMQDPRMTLTTPTLNYDLNTRTATYNEGGTIVDPENRLESRVGSYDVKSKMYTFQQNVKVYTADYNITAQNLKYNTQSRIVYFSGPTFIKGEKGDLYAEEGSYNTLTKVSNFGRNAYILTKEYRLGGDKLFYDQAKGYGVAEKNVTLRSLKDDVTIRGNVGKYWRDKGVAKVYGTPVMETILDKDTLYLSADTLYSREAKGAKVKSMLYAYPNVKIFKKDLQGKADSLSYNRTDSIMHMNRKPVLWNDQSQLVSDTIRIHLKNKTIDKMYMFSNAFISSEDTLKNYNQVKGRNMVGYFKDGKIRKVDVLGNAESVYFALEGDTALTGMNKAISSNMRLRFEDNKLKAISFLVQPDANFIPPHELNEADRKLEGFNWYGELRPTKKDVFAKRVPAKPKAQPKKSPAKNTKKPKKETSGKK